MSDKTHKTLSDLLGAARTGFAAEHAEEFVSANEAERLVANSLMRDVPSMWQRIQMRLLSTPLRLSITAMTTAALITIGTLAVRSLTSSILPDLHTAKPLPSTKIAALQDSIHANTSRKRESTAPIVSAPDSIRIEVRATAPRDPIPAIPVVPSIPEVRPVEPTRTQLDALGIMLDDSGGIQCEFPREQIRFGPNGAMQFDAGLMPKDSSTGWKEPRLVTSPNGSKRFFSYVSFSKDTAVEKADGNGKKTNIRVRVEERTIVSNDSEASALARGTQKTNAVLHSYGSHARVNLRVDSTLRRGEVRVELPSSARVRMLDRSRAVIHYDSSVSKDRSQTLIGPGSSTRVVLDPDSTQIQPLIKAIAILVKKDSAFHRAVVNSDIAQTERDSVELLVKQLGDELARNDQVEGDSANEDQSQLIFQQLASELNRQASTAPNFDNLIPILVRNTKNPKHPNELIFWYESTPEITNLLPAAKQSTHDPKPQSFEVSVYPNPTSGPATLNYTLKHDASVTFTLRNLLGQKVMEIGNANGSAGTTGNLTFDLSKLEAGLYLLVTTTDSGEQSVERIVVNK